jgi:prevent-host-death family protein
MTEKVSTMDVRARIGDMLNRVALRHDEFIIERKGRPLAALVPVERLEQMRRFARQHALEFLDRQKEGAGNQLSDEEAMAVALDAQREVRQRHRKAATKAKPKRLRK